MEHPTGFWLTKIPETIETLYAKCGVLCSAFMQCGSYPNALIFEQSLTVWEPMHNMASPLVCGVPKRVIGFYRCTGFVL